MDVLPLLVAHVLGVQRLAADSRAADEHVEPRQLLDGRVQLRRVAHVVAVREVEDVHVGASGLQALDDGGADSARAARDERDAAFEVVMVGSCVYFYTFRP